MTLGVAGTSEYKRLAYSVRRTRASLQAKLPLRQGIWRQSCMLACSEPAPGWGEEHRLGWGYACLAKVDRCRCWPWARRARPPGCGHECPVGPSHQPLSRRSQRPGPRALQLGQVGCSVSAAVSPSGDARASKGCEATSPRRQRVGRHCASYPSNGRSTRATWSASTAALSWAWPAR